MPLPKPRAGESSNQFVQRCMIDDTSMSEYPDTQQRYAVCRSISARKSIQTKQNRRKVSTEFEKQIRIAQKKNLPIAYQFYIVGYDKAVKMYEQNPTPTNQNFNTLFTEKEVNVMYKQMYRQTGLRFAYWYRKHFKLFVNKMSEFEFERLLDRIERGQQLTAQERRNLESTIIEGLDRYATQRSNYLATAKEVTSVNGVALQTLKKVITDLTKSEEFMSMGLEERVREISKRLRFKARWMARRIVQTETTASANFGIQLSAQDIYGEDNLVKEWISGGRNVRDTHRSADIQYGNNPIPSNEPYQVGGSLLMFPSDTSLGATAKEVVNCKCLSVPFVQVD